MNCPSRTDEPMTEHPDWNQNPPFLAPDLTTRQDLNGIANAREHRGGSGDGVDMQSLADGRRGDVFLLANPPAAEDGEVLRWGWRSSGRHPQTKGAFGHPSDGQSLSSFGRGSTTAAAAGAPTTSSPMGWFVWTASVLLCAAALSAFRAPELVVTALLGQSRDAGQASSLIRRGLARRSTCESGGVSADDYNAPLHAGALVIILATSFLACSFPLVAARVPGLRVPEPFFFGVRHFGTGVLLATAFVHLLPTAFTLLGDPCLSSFWVDDYPAMPGAIALAAVFFVTVIEMVLQPARHMTPSGGVVGGGHGGCMSGSSVAATQVVRPSMDRRRGENQDEAIRVLDNGDDTPRPAESGKTAVVDEERRQDAHGAMQLTPQQQHQKAILQCMMLEVGILFHSVFIGMTLSVSIGREFIILLIAIAFHQTFEGLALGSRIAAIKWDAGSWQPWMMCLAYGCTTPLGQAIGIATHQLYNPRSEFGLVLVGTMNAISSGLLVFASLVELLSEDFLSDESWRVLRGRRRVTACLLVLLGAIGMSLVGAWA